LRIKGPKKQKKNAGSGPSGSLEEHKKEAGSGPSSNLEVEARTEVFEAKDRRLAEGAKTTLRNRSRGERDRIVQRTRGRDGDFRANHDFKEHR
jgi:hypothetical protein